MKLGPQLPFAAGGARLVNDALQLSQRQLRRLVKVDPFGQSFDDVRQAGRSSKSGGSHDLSVSRGKRAWLPHGLHPPEDDVGGQHAGIATTANMPIVA